MYCQVMLALVRDSTGSNWPVGKGAGRNGRAGKLWRVGKSEEVGFKARKKLITSIIIIIIVIPGQFIKRRK